MTQTEQVSDYGRWPGYTEQSWQQRFAELDRRHNEMLARFEAHIRSTSPARAATWEAACDEIFGSPAGEVGEILADAKHEMAVFDRPSKRTALAMIAVFERLEVLEAAIVQAREALERIAERAKKLRGGTDDWFELAEFELTARQALSALDRKG